MNWFFWPWKYGERQPQAPDDLPDDFTEGQDDEDDDDVKGNKNPNAT